MRLRSVWLVRIFFDVAATMLVVAAGGQQPATGQPPGVLAPGAQNETAAQPGVASQNTFDPATEAAAVRCVGVERREQRQQEIKTQGQFPYPSLRHPLHAHGGQVVALRTHPRQTWGWSN